MRPGLFWLATVPPLFSGRLKITGNCGENRIQRTTNGIDHGENCDPDAGSNEAVFDGGHAGLVFDNALQKAGMGYSLISGIRNEDSRSFDPRQNTG